MKKQIGGKLNEKEAEQTIIWIADAFAVTRIGIRDVVNAMEGPLIVKEASDFQMLLSQQAEFAEFTKHVYIIDSKLVGSEGVYDIVQQLSMFVRNPYILFLTDFKSRIFEGLSFPTGNCSFFSRMEDCMAIQHWLADIGNESIAPKGYEINGEPKSFWELMHLSKREQAVLGQLIAGLSLKEVGKLLQIEYTTVVTYRDRLFQKFDVNNISEAIALLTELGVLKAFFGMHHN